MSVSGIDKVTILRREDCGFPPTLSFKGAAVWRFVILRSEAMKNLAFTQDDMNEALTRNDSVSGSLAIQLTISQRFCQQLGQSLKCSNCIL